MIFRGRVGPLARRELPYLAVSAVVLVWTVAVVVQGRWIGDFSLHVATVRTFAAHLTSPPDPMLGTAGGSPYDSPYAFVLALVVRVLGVSPVRVLELAAIGNVALLLVAWRWAVGELTVGQLTVGQPARELPRRSPGASSVGEVTPPTAAARAPAVAAVSLAALLLLWGWDPPQWSGFPNLTSLALTSPYPSTFALGLELLAWSAFWRLRLGASLVWAVPLSLLMALLVLVHPFTALTAVLGLAAIAVVRPRQWSGSQLLAVAGAAVAAALLAVAWPFSSIRQLVANDAAFDEIHRPLVAAATQLGGMQAYGFMLVAVPALVWTVVARRRPELAVMAVLGIAVFVAAAATGHLAFARVVPLVMVAAALALGLALSEPTRGRGWVAVAAVTVVVAGVGLVGQRAAVATALPTGDLQRLITRAVPPPFGPSVHALDRAVRDGETVAATSEYLRRRLNGAGAFTLTPGWPDPWNPEVPQRQAAYDRLVSATTTPQQRAAIADAYRVRCIAVQHGSGLLALVASGRLAPFDNVTPLPGGDRLLCRTRHVAL